MKRRAKRRKTAREDEGQMSMPVARVSVLLFLASAVISGSAAGGNLVSNPGFEAEKAADGKIPGWPSVTSARVSVDTEGTHTGKACLKVSGGRGSEVRSEVIPVKPDTCYRLAGWVKCSSTADARRPHATLRATRIAQGKAGGENIVTGPWGTYEWTLIETEFCTRDADTIQISLHPGWGGATWFDDIVLKGVSGEGEPASPDSAAGANLLPNAGFEKQEPDRTGGVEGWVGGQLDTEVVHNGRASFRMTSTKPNLIRLRGRPRRRIAVQPNKTYKLSGWIRTRDVQMAEIRLFRFGAEGKRVGCEHATTPVVETKDWTLVDTVFSSDKAEQVYLWLHLPVPRMGSEAWFDDVLLQEVAGQGKVSDGNLVLNSDFSICTTPGIPDHWGVGQLVPATTRNFDYGVDLSQESPVPGARALKFSREAQTERTHLSTQRNSLRLVEGRRYTFSVYLKADTPDFPVIVSLWRGHRDVRNRADFHPSREWRCCTWTMAADKPGTYSLNFSIGGRERAGTLWLAAPQFEEGVRATAYAPSPRDKGLRGSGEALARLPAVPRTLCPKAPQAPELDGRLDDDCWKNAATISGFKLGSGEPSPVQTVGYVTHGRDGLYIAFRCFEPEMEKLAEQEKETASLSAAKRLWQSDHVEVFVAPNGEGFPYYQFAVNRRGDRFESASKNRHWQAEWYGRGAAGEKEWTLEIKVPFAILPLWDAEENWRISLCRVRGIGGTVNSSWPAAAFHNPKRFAHLDGIEKEVLRLYRLRVGDLALEDRSDNTLSLSGWVVSKQAAAGATVRVKATLSAAETEQTRSSTVDLSGGGAPFELSGFPAGAGRYRVALSVEDPEEDLALRQVITDLKPGEQRASPVSPLTVLTEYSYYTDEPEAKVCLRWSLPFPVDVKVEQDKVGFEEEVRLGGTGETMVTLPIKGIADGTYPVRVTAMGTSGVITGVTEELVKLPHSKTGNVRVNKVRGFLEVNGKPFFPIVAYGLRTYEEWQIQKVKAHGFNTVQVACGGDPDEVERRLSLCADHGLKVLAFTWIDIENFAEWKENILGIVRRHKEHPGIIGWCYVDEPDAWWEKKGYEESQLVTMYDALKAEDPYRPAFPNHASSISLGREPFGTLECEDILCYDCYAVKRPDSLNYYARHAMAARVWGMTGGEPVFVLPQNWGSGPQPREPTPDEYRNMVMVSLIYRMRGLVPYSAIPYSRPLWESQKALYSQIHELTSRVLFRPGAREIQTAKAGLDIHYGLWQTGKELYLLVANTSSEKTGFDIDVEDLSSMRVKAADVLFETASPRVSVKQGILTDTLGPAKTRVYRFDL